ncbi:hypothetical protein JCGZ_06066 [Jatropha curcas]|uniref:Uncharacterized protein n=1 Tax=Jatropha curcas TaxID=180498 RepID=A0A067KXL0_JATCU|nr:uncharacterized protein LOC105634780 [Jatropha curcas]KDP37010.1 hypothetical protein JCGZ_06066 [Jatropha curcas]
MSEDDWVTVAMTDDTLVVQLLLKLHQAESPPPLPNKISAPALRLEWTVRQRRSKQLPRKKADATRASPTTPLSWSGGTSVSGCAADGFEESSLLVKPIDSARSKVAAANETPTTKRSRKKKTLPELKEEESLLLKERRNLKNQLANLRLTVEKQRTANEKLKRLKLDLLSKQPPQTDTSVVKTEKVNSNQPEQIKVETYSIKPIIAACTKHEPSSPDASFQKQEGGGREFSFMLPDLNLPVEDNSSSHVLRGIS